MMAEVLVQRGQLWHRRFAPGEARVEWVAPATGSTGPLMFVTYWAGGRRRTVTRSRFVRWYRPAAAYRRRRV